MACGSGGGALQTLLRLLQTAHPEAAILGGIATGDWILRAHAHGGVRVPGVLAGTSAALANQPGDRTDQPYGSAEVRLMRAHLRSAACASSDRVWSGSCSGGTSLSPRSSAVVTPHRDSAPPRFGRAMPCRNGRNYRNGRVMRCEPT